MTTEDASLSEAAAPDSLEALGLAVGPERVYRCLLSAQGAQTIDQIAGALSVEPADVDAWLIDLVADELCVRDGTSVEAAPPHSALVRLFSRREEALAQAARRLHESRGRVDELLAAYLAGHRSRLTDKLDRVDSTEGVRAALRHIAGRATTSVLSVVAEVPPLRALEESLDSDRAALDRGVQLRCVYPSAMLDDPALAAVVRVQAASGAAIRLHPAPRLRALVIDDVTAVLPVDPVGARPGAWLVREEGLLAPVQALLTSIWASGFPLSAEVADAVAEARIREVFHLLAQGVKDEGIARRLGTSVRTVRRLVADGMELLGASSRFEAGVMAARKGWLADA